MRDWTLQDVSVNCPCNSSFWVLERGGSEIRISREIAAVLWGWKLPHRGRARVQWIPITFCCVVFFLLLTYSVVLSTPDDACRPGYDRVIFMYYKTSLELSSVVLYCCFYIQFSTVSPPTLSHCTTVNFSLAPRARISNDSKPVEYSWTIFHFRCSFPWNDWRTAGSAQGRSQAKTSAVIQSSRQTSRSPCRRYHNDREQRDWMTPAQF